MDFFYKVINFISTPFVLIRDKVVERSLKGLNEKERFSLFYKSGYWKPIFGGSMSGSGSSMVETAMIREGLPVFLRAHNITSMLDIPCGDWHWMSDVNLEGINYIGGDIVGELVDSNSKKYTENNIEFVELDVVNDRLPKADLVFVRDCFVHLEDDSIICAIHNVINSGSKYFATTTYPKCSNNGKTLNKDRWRELNMMLSPFFFPEPLELLPDMVDEALDNKYVGVWKVSDLNKISVS